MKTEQMPERIAILTPTGMDTVDPSQFYVTAPCPGGEYAVKGTGYDYAEYVRADATLWDVPKIEAGCWTNIRGLSMGEALKVLVAYGYSGGWLDIKALTIGEASIVRKTPKGTIITRVKGAAEDGVDAEVIIAALSQSLARYPRIISSHQPPPGGIFLSRGHHMTESVTAQSITSAAIGHMKERATTYDAPQGERSMAKTVTAFNALTGLSLTTEQGWLFMLTLKMARSQQGAYRADNYEDAVAYAALLGEQAAQEKRHNG